MDLYPLLKAIGDTIEVNNSGNYFKYKGNSRTLGSVDKNIAEGYFKLNFIESNDVITWDIEFKQCPKEEINEEIFFMKSLPTNTGRTILSITVDEMFRDVFGGKRSTIERVANLTQDERLLRIINFFNDNKLIHPNDWNGSIIDMMTTRYSKLADKYLQYPITVFYNNKMLMKEDKFQNLWVQEFFKVSSGDIKCSYCGTDKNVIKNGKIKWGMFTTKRKTQFCSEGNSLCLTCSNLISMGIDVLERFKIRIGKNTVGNNEYFMIIPLTYNKNKLRSFYNKLSKLNKESFHNEFNFYNALTFIYSEIKLMNIDKVALLKYGTNEKTTFELSYIDIVDIEIFNKYKKEEIQYKFEKYLTELGIYCSVHNDKYPYQLINIIEKDTSMNKTLTETLLLLFSNPSELHEDKLYKILNKLDVVISQNKHKYKNYQNHPFNRGFNYQYQIYHYLAKGNIMEKIYNSKDYALGVLLKITHQLQKKKHDKNQSPILKKYSNNNNYNNISKSIKKIVLREWENLNLYQKKIYHYALEKFINGEQLNKSVQESAFMLGFSSENHYPDYLDREDFWNNVKKENDKNETVEIVGL